MATTFTRPFDAARLHGKEQKETVTAEGSELEALASQLKLPAVHALKADFVLSPWRAGGVRVTGHFTAEVEQVCVVSLDHFTEQLSGDFERFYTGSAQAGTGEVIELDSDEDEVPDEMTDGRIDLAAIAAEELALSLDPYPRKPGASFSGHIELSDEEMEDGAGKNPFGVLAQLKKH